MSNDRLYFRQLLAGRDYARDDPIARQMVNFTYLIGDRETGEAVVVDPAYAVGDLVELVGTDGMQLTGVLATHYHPDHIGGDMMGFSIEGVRDLLATDGVKVRVHAQRDEAWGIQRVTGLSAGDLVLHDSGDTVQVGDVEIALIHTPGHTPGSQCFLVDGRLVSGDTLFLDGCGRTDLPGGDAEALYYSVHDRLSRIPDDTLLYPGHLYSPEASATLGETRRSNYVFRFADLDQWMSMFGGH